MLLQWFRLFVTPWTAARQAPLSMGFSRQEYWSGLPFPAPGDLPHPGTELVSPESPALQVDSLPPSDWGSPREQTEVQRKGGCSLRPHSRSGAEPEPRPPRRAEESCRAAALGRSALSVAGPGWWEWGEQRGAAMELTGLAGQRGATASP